jgi:hypothetical protein
MGRSGKVVFKQYAQNGIEFLPASYEEIIPEGHLVRLGNPFEPGWAIFLDLIQFNWSILLALDTRSPIAHTL